jgi:hypothetical protein
MSEGSWVPTSWKEAIPYVVWVVLVLGFGLEFVAALVHGEWLRAVISFVGLVALMAAALHWNQIKSWAAQTNPNWVIATLSLVLAGLILSPFLEQRRWPFSPQFEAPLPSPPLQDALSAASARSPDDLSWVNALYLEGAFLRVPRPCLVKLSPATDVNINSRNILAKIIADHNACQVVDDIKDQARRPKDVDSSAPPPVNGMIVRWRREYMEAQQTYNMMKGVFCNVAEGHTMPAGSPDNLIWIVVGDNYPWPRNQDCHD